MNKILDICSLTLDKNTLSGPYQEGGKGVAGEKGK